jgi:prepilin-type N-terminal cleavage/methylation domain-containing protein
MTSPSDIQMRGSRLRALRPELVEGMAHSQRLRRGLSLVELIVSMIIASVVLVSLFTIYSHARRDADSISTALENSELPQRILQLIAQDLDRFSADTEVETKRENGLVSSTFILESRIYDSLMRQLPYERIIWQTRYDAETQSMILYRGHSGLVSEDKLLESQRTPEERRQLIPLCNGLTHFEVKAFIQGSERVAYAGTETPTQVIVSLSFAEPEKKGNEYVIPPDQIVTRTIAVNRLRKIGYIFTEPNLAGLGRPDEPGTTTEKDVTESSTDPNKPGGGQ